MPRRALRAFFERVVIAALPIVAPACSGNHERPDGGSGGSGGGMIAADMSAVGDDMSGIYDPPPPPPADTCEPMHPAFNVVVTPGQLVDGGTDNLCRSGGECAGICSNGYTICCGPQDADGGTQVMTCSFDCGPTGRRPAGLTPATPRAGCDVGQYLASMAHLEAASVHAFRVLARRLRRHGAPASLVARARTAARDEIRHARLARALAARHGATPPPVRVTPPLETALDQPATENAPLEQLTNAALEQLATENATEGCVRETFGALLAAFQARAAADPGVRAAMSDIADDEAAHAELAWDLDAWLATRLDAAARDRVRAARTAAVASLGRELESPFPSLLAASVGLPDVARAQALLGAARARLWA